MEPEEDRLIEASARLYSLLQPEIELYGQQTITITTELYEAYLNLKRALYPQKITLPPAKEIRARIKEIEHMLDDTP